MNDFAENEWKRAIRTLRTAMSIANDDPESACSRAYYAAFHAVSALFSLDDLRFKKHSALRAAVHQRLVKTNIWPDELGKTFDILMDLRENADYGSHTTITPEDARATVEMAQRIIDEIRASTTRFT